MSKHIYNIIIVKFIQEWVEFISILLRLVTDESIPINFDLSDPIGSCLPKSIREQKKGRIGSTEGAWR